MRLRLTTLLIFSLFSFAAISQDSVYHKDPAFGVHFFFNDFKSAAAIRASPLGSALRDKKLAKIKEMKPGLALSYVKGIASHFDFAATLGGTFVAYPTQNGILLGEESLLLEADASLRAKMVSDDYYVVPYLSVGVGASKFRGYYGATAPVGAGLQFNLFKNAFLILSSQYMIKITDNTNYHFVHSIGFCGRISGK